MLRLIRDILYFEPERRGTSAAQALEFLVHVLKRRAIVFLISDLMGESYRPEAIRQPLGIVARKHDLVVISVSDPAEKELPKLGLVELEDAETGELAMVDTSDPALRKRFVASQSARQESVERLFRQLGIDHIPVSTAEDFTKKLHQFFQKRARRYR